MFTATFKLTRPFIIAFIWLLLILSLSRIALGLWQIERVDSLTAFITLLFNGFRVDLSTGAYLLLIPAIIHPWAMFLDKTQRWISVLRVLFLVVFIAVLFFELTTPAFITEYGFRPNRLFVEYLGYPKEVMSMLVNGHILTLVIVSLALAIISVGLWKLISRYIVISEPTVTSTIKSSSTASLLMLLIFILCARGTIGHRPLNPSFVYFTTDPLVNSLTLNSIYSVAHAVKAMGDEKNAAKMYGKMSDENIVKLVRKSTGLPETAFDNVLPTSSVRQPVYQGKPKNLVIILQESLGAQFVGSLGGLPLTPEIDKLMPQGWGFTNLYATGTRSVRGIEAVITGFTPTPARSVVKLDKSQHNFFTIANLLKQEGYKTQFIYGGESHFDNMKSFFLGNGFTDIVDFNDIESPNFVASWGASDEDLFNQADIELQKSKQSAKPFFSFIFTSSNHDPFDIPDRNIEPIKYTTDQLKKYDDKERSRHKAIQYADYAVGNFIAKAKKQDYWQDTIFVIVADHDARISGADLVPIKHFQIPALILNSNHENKLDNRLTSQIDLAPTLLSLMGIENYSPMLGHDLNNEHLPNRVMMQYANNFAYMNDNGVAILQPDKETKFFNYDFANKKLSLSKKDDELAETALAHALWGSLAFKNDWYQFVFKTNNASDNLVQSK